MSGTEASIKKLTPADLRAFYDAYYHPNNAALIVAGDTTEAALRGKLEAAFKGWRGRHVAAHRLPAPAAPRPRPRSSSSTRRGRRSRRSGSAWSASTARAPTTFRSP